MVKWAREEVKLRSKRAVEFSPCPKIEKSEIHRGDTRNGGKGKKLTRNFQNVKNKGLLTGSKDLKLILFIISFLKFQKQYFNTHSPQMTLCGGSLP